MENQMSAAEKFMSKLTKDNVFVGSEIIDLAKATGFKTRKGLEHGVISNGTLVNAVSKSYGHLPNETFFGEVECQLNAANIKFVTRSINREDRSFVVDYILNDDSFIVKVKTGKDRILPMLRFTNSYDGSCKSSGHFGYFREVCSNGLHIASTNLNFSVKHSGKVLEVSMAGIDQIVNKFMENEYYSLSRKFDVLAETYIKDLKGFVKATAEQLNLFKYEASAKNAEPSLNARLVLNLIEKEAKLLGTQPTLWLGYNAFNEMLHGKLVKTFDKQAELDGKLFEHVLELV
jgi:hypothetical protein